MKISIVLCSLIIALVSIEPAMAMPGGKIAGAFFDSNWGKILLGLLYIVLFPFIIYVNVVEKFSERRSKKDLQYMTQYSALFEWVKIREHVKECFYSVHSGWSNENLVKASNFMTDWYWQNQQLVYLDRWKNEGLVNICNVKKISNITPLFFMHTNDEVEHEGSIIAISINAKMQDYLKNKKTGKTIEGSKRYKEVDAIWIFTLIDNEWKVSDIEEGSMSLIYAKLVKELHPIEETIVRFNI